MCYTTATDERKQEREDEEPKLYARTLVGLTPDNPEDGAGIPAGAIVEVTDNNTGGSSRLMAHYREDNEIICMDVLLSELDTDI